MSTQKNEGQHHQINDPQSDPTIPGRGPKKADPTKPQEEGGSPMEPPRGGASEGPPQGVGLPRVPRGRGAL